MSVLDPFYMKHGQVVEHMAAAAEQIPGELAGWKPCEKAHPWLRLIDHTSVGTRHLVLKALKKEPLDMGAFADPANMAKTPGEAAQAQRGAWDELKRFLQSRPEDFVKSEVPFTRGRMMTVEQLCWFLFEQYVHHRGQAWIYARMNGITPPAIWGTEQPD